ncbi:hypothetical protein SAAL107622_04965 [Lacicoccus alkaliphilus]|uniref:Uncharacterized protein n=1 Tax=Lacicoccus alkaliphilus DSM 16010 TaxID=1123231 RepID=A0A1M7CLR8_9BACL|nr:hypothetical protein SAMN02745189_00823 [Salinicoccus alkaliphilus DSM 16010]
MHHESIVIVFTYKKFRQFKKISDKRLISLPKRCNITLNIILLKYQINSELNNLQSCEGNLKFAMLI